MKKSIYNSVHLFDTQKVLYNAFTDKMCILDLVVADLYEKHEPSELKSIHPSFYEYLQEQQFILQEDTDEVCQLIETWQQNDTDATTFTLTVNPTLNCNMHCWYCYEHHQGNLNMNEDVFNRLLKFISSKTAEPQLKSFSLGLFGGEPLLNFNTVGRKLIEHCRVKCEENDCHFSMSCVTNGSLLSDDIIEFLSAIKCHVAFQITMDGNEPMHNSIRQLNNEKGSYFLILQNCVKLLHHDTFSVVLRCNFTRQNLLSFLDVAYDLSQIMERQGGDSSHLIIDLHQIWQDVKANDSVKEDIQEQERSVREAFQSKGFNVTAEKPVKRYRCYADRNNHALVNYDGNIFRCTARDFVSENAEGVLTPNGQIIWNAKSNIRDSIKWANVTCRQCRLYPICGGNCSQYKLEQGGSAGCYFGYSEEKKTTILRKRIEWMLNRTHPKP